MDHLFETERMIVRKLRSEDARRLFEIHSGEKVRKWFPNECYADAREAADAISFFSDCVEQGRLPYVLAVESKETGELIGDAGVSEVEGQPDAAEIGYVICDRFSGQGYATELAGAMTGYAESRFGTRILYGRVIHGNDASARVLEKNGYTFVKEELGAEDDPYGNGMLVYQKEN